MLLQWCQARKTAVSLVFGLLANCTGLENNDIRALCLVRGSIANLLELIGNLTRIRVIHLATTYPKMVLLNRLSPWLSIPKFL